MSAISANLSRFRDAIVTFSGRKTPGELPAEFLLAQEGNLAQYYIPFDAVNTRALVVLVGITPGYVQWYNAVTTAQKVLREGGDDALALREAKKHGAFSGPLRNNLVKLLDGIGLAQMLSLDSTAQLFTDHTGLVHCTSLYTQPLFVKGVNYNGTPHFSRSALLRASIDEGFAQEAAVLKKAVFIPLGPVATEGVNLLASRGVLDEARILSGLPHPSGANMERISYFLGLKARDTLSSRTNADLLDQAKASLLAKVGKLVFV